MTKNRYQKGERVDGRRNGTGHPVPMEVPDVPSRSAANTDNPNLGEASSLDDQTGKVVRLQRQRDGRSLRQLHPLEYNAWRAMKDRARTEGAVIHERWEDFANFLEDMEPKPRGDFSLDRIDPTNPMYGPGLCEWRDKKHQSRNRRNVHLLTDTDGTTMTLPAWAELTGQNANTLRKRKARGWPDTWVIHGKPKEALGSAPAATAVSWEEAVDALPYPVDSREKKLRCEREYRLKSRARERRLEFFIRWCKHIMGEAVDKIPCDPPPGYDHDDLSWSDDEMVRNPEYAEAVRRVNVIPGYIEAAQRLLAEELERERERQRPDEGRRRTEHVLLQPSNFGRAVETQLDVIAFGYAPNKGHLQDEGGHNRGQSIRPITWDEWDGWEDLEGEVSDEDGD